MKRSIGNSPKSPAESVVSPEWERLVSLPADNWLLGDEIDLGRLLKLAHANELLLWLGARLRDVGIAPLPGHYEALYRRDARRARQSQRFMAKILPRFEAAGLPLLTMKTFLSFPYADSNVDVIAVKSTELRRYRHLLHEMGYRRRRNLADLREPRKEMYVAPDTDTPLLHLHQALSWNGVVYLNVEQVWAQHRIRRIDGINVPIPAVADEILIMAAHAIFENKYVSLHELHYLQDLTAQEIDWNSIWYAAAQLHWQAALELFLGTVLSLARQFHLRIRAGGLPSPVQLSQANLPYIFPPRETFLASWRKLKQDVASGSWRVLPRQLFCYTLVDAFWMYRKAWHKRVDIR